QVTAGKGTFPGTPLNSGIARCSAKNCSTAASICRVVTPGRTNGAAIWWAFQTSRPALRIWAISREDRRTCTLGNLLVSSILWRGPEIVGRQLLSYTLFARQCANRLLAAAIQRGGDTAEHHLGRPFPVNRPQQSLNAVIVAQRRRLTLVLL